MPKDEREGRSDAAVAIVRRAPFSDNPAVGVRGLRTQQRILDAALQAFADEGYHGCSVDRIMKLAQCSRVSFYQYFGSKDDVFRELAGQVARQVSASTEALDPLTDDPQGRAALRHWVGRYAEIHARYEPVFHAVDSDNDLAAVAWHTGEETVARIHARLSTAMLTPRQLDPVIRLLLECVNHTLDISGILRSVTAEGYPAERVETAITDVVHRTVFGLHADVNVHPPAGEPPPALLRGGEMVGMVRPVEAVEPEAPVHGALDALLASGREVFVERGYHNTRVDDLVEAAGVSHGAFYRYFRNKEQLARMLTARAVEAIGAAVADMPDVYELDPAAGTAALRRWLRRYHSAQSEQAAMMRVWVDAAHQDPALRAESAPLLSWGRWRMARYLQPRGFGDVDSEALVMVGLLGVFGARPRPAAEVDAAAHIIERGLLGRTRENGSKQ